MKKKIIILEIIILFILIIAVFLIIFLLNYNITNKIIKSKKIILNYIEETYGYTIRYKKISPNILSKIKIEEAVIYNNANSILELGNIEVSYSIFNLIFNHKNPVSILKKISLKKLNLKINDEDDIKKLRELISNLKNKKNNQFKIKKLIIEIQKGKIFYINKNNEYSININNLNLDLSDEIKISSSVNLIYKNKNKIIFITQINSNGIIYKKDNNITSSKLEFSILKTKIYDYQIKDQYFTYIKDNDNYIFNRKKDNQPIEFLIQKVDDNFYININIKDLKSENLFVNNNKIPGFPDLITLNFDYQNKIKESINYGKFIYHSKNNSLKIFDKLNTNLEIDIINNIINFKKCIISNDNVNNYINFTGYYSLKKQNNNFNINIDIHDFKLFNNLINSKITINKNNNIIILKSNDFLINNEKIGIIDYLFYKNNNDYIVKCLNDFNGYSFNGIFGTDKNNKKIINIKHNFNNFNIDKIVKIFNKNFNNKISLNGQILNIYQNNLFFIKDSEINIKKDSLLIGNILIYYQNNILNIKSNMFNDNNQILQISSESYFNNDPIVSYVKINNDKIKLDIKSKFSKELFNISINNNLNISLNHKEKKIYFYANNFLIPYNGLQTAFSFNFIYNIKYNTISDNLIVIDKINIFKKQTGIIKCKFNFYNNKINFYNIKYTDETSELIGNFVIDINRNDKLLYINSYLKDNISDESYLFELSLNKLKELNSKLFITHLNINKLIDSNKIEGFLDISLDANGLIFNPNANLKIELSKGKFNKKKLESNIFINKDKDEINIKNAYFQINENFILIKNSKISNDNNKKVLNLNGILSFEGLEKKIRANFTIDGTIENNNYNISLNFNKLLLAYLIKNELVENDKVEINNLKFNISKNQNMLKIQDSESKFFIFTYINKFINMKIFKENNTVLESNVDVSNKNLNGYVKFNKFPVNFIKIILFPFISIDDGLLEGELILNGKIDKPEFTGKLNVFYGVVLLPQYLQAPIEDITGFIIADKNKFLIRNVNAKVRKGLAHGYGEVIFNNWKLERYDFHINSDEIPAKISQGPVDAEGIGYIKDFIIQGEPQNYNFIGDVFIESANINLAGLMGLTKEGQLKKYPLNVIINFESGKKINVNYPIFKGTIKPGQKFYLKYYGEIPIFYLGGTVEMAKGDVNYLNKNFKIEYAIFQFFEDEDTVNPNVNLKAFYKTKDFKNESVKIYLNINDRLIPFNTTFSSFPAKSQDEIQGLLGLNYAYAKTFDTENTTDSNNLDILINTTDYIGNTFILSMFENKIRKITSLDTFSLDTKLFGNIIKYNSGQYTSTLDLLDDTSITIGKYLFNQLYFESILSFHKKSEKYTEFFLPFNDQNYGLNLQFMLQLELKYLSFGYTYVPKSYKEFLKADHLLSIEANFRF